MPRLPVVDIGRRNLRALNQPEASARDFGAGIGSALTEAGNVFQQIQEASDEAESRRIIESTKSKIEGAIKQTDSEVVDPDAYYSQAAGRIEEIRKLSLESASSDRVRGRVGLSLEPYITRAQTSVQWDRRQKQVKKAKGESALYLDEATDRSMRAQDPLEQQIIDTEVKDHLRKMTALGAYDQDEAAKKLVALNDKVQIGRAYSHMEKDPPGFLRSVAQGGYKELDSQKRLQLVREGNTLISSEIAGQKREQQVKQEAADREIQMLVDKNAPPTVIDNRLKELTVSGVFGRSDRKFWDDYLAKDEKNDSPEQTKNFNTFKTIFLEQGYPTLSAVNKGREQAKAMRDSGQLGVKGAGDLQKMFTTMEQSLRSEGRAIESQTRARESHARGGAGGKEKKMSDNDALELIGTNYAIGTPTKPVNAQHKKDVAEFVTRKGLGGEDPGTVAREITTRGQQKKQEAQQQKEKQTTAAKADPASAAILNRLKELPKR